MDNGYIKLHRKFKNWEWYKNIPVKTLFSHCLIMANFKNKKWQGIDIKRGSFITSYKTLSNETGLSERQIRTALDKLKLTNELTVKSNTRYSVITVLKYNDYQTNDTPLDNQMTNKRHASDTPATTTNKDKKEKNDNKSIKKDTKKKPIPKTKYLDFVLLTDEEYNKLKEKFNSKLDYHIENLNNYIGSTGKKYKSHYHTILNWNRKNNTPRSSEEPNKYAKYGE